MDLHYRDYSDLNNQHETDALRFLASPTHKKAKALLDYWSAKRGENAMPFRKDIDPIEIGILLPHILLIDIDLSEGPRFKIRLAGTGVVDFLHEEPTGKYVEEIGSALPEAAKTKMRIRWFKTCDHVYKEQQPAFVSVQHADPNQSFSTAHAAALPLTIDGTSVSHILGLTVTAL